MDGVASRLRERETQLTGVQERAREVQGNLERTEESLALTSRKHLL